MLLVASWLDVTTRRIPNWLTIAGMVAGVAVRAPLGLGAVESGVLGVGVGLLLALPFFLAGVLGGGDAKLLMAVGAFMGPRELLPAALVIAVVGGVVAAGEAMRRGVLRPTLASCGALILGWVTLGRRGGSPPGPAAPERLAVPYGLAIAAGSLLWWFAGGTVV